MQRLTAFCRCAVFMDQGVRENRSYGFPKCFTGRLRSAVCCLMWITVGMWLCAPKLWIKTSRGKAAKRQARKVTGTDSYK